MTIPREVPPEPDVRLDQMEKDEWRDACRRLRPDWTDEDFERAWAEFQAIKRRKQAQ